MMSQAVGHQKLEAGDQGVIGSQPAGDPAFAGASQRWRTLAEPLRPDNLPRGLDAMWLAGHGRIQGLKPRRKIFMRRATRILEMAKAWEKAPDSRMRETAQQLRSQFKLGRDTPTELDEAYALICEIIRRQFGFTVHAVQVAAGLALNGGCLAELATGEGKTLSATLPAVVAGWRGRGCHVITVNSYLAKRDAEEMGGIYRFCGLTVASLEDETPPEQRRAAYGADVTYCTNKDVAADFLRDSLVLGQSRQLPTLMIDRLSNPDASSRGMEGMVMRGLEFAIIDEADSILIDEAVTPLIISGDSPNAEQVEAYDQAAALAAQLEVTEHFTIDNRWREVNLTPAGRDLLAQKCENMSGLWQGARRREELIVQALVAREMYKLDKQYVIEDEKIVIVDEFTGRLMPDRTWRDGLHQAVEAKEGLEVQPPKATLARISFQRFFRMYGKLSGMTGTAWESRHEVWQTYKTPVVKLKTHQPCIRKHTKDRIYRNAEGRWQGVIEMIKTIHATGRPVLIGTRSVGASERLSELLVSEGLEHLVLNAVRHAEEAHIVAGAGQKGQITIATNMAGRGTDIKLSRGVAELGGLAVISAERNDSGRIDRQLYGRAGRQGDPGSAQAVVSCEDELMVRYGTWWSKALLKVLTPGNGGTSGMAARWLVDHAQTKAQKIARRQRIGVLRTDDWLDENLAFAGSEV